MGFIKELILRSKLKTNNGGKKNFVSWDKLKTIALIVDHKSAANKNQLDKFIYETDKVVDVCPEIDPLFTEIELMIGAADAST